MPPMMFFVASNRSEAMIFTSTGKLTSPIASEMATLSSWRFLGAGSTIKRSISLSLVIWPVTADPNSMIFSGRVTVKTRRTISRRSISSTAIPLLSYLCFTPSPFLLLGARRTALGLAERKHRDRRAHAQAALRVHRLDGLFQTVAAHHHGDGEFARSLGDGDDVHLHARDGGEDAAS